MFSTVRADVAAVLERDPACRSRLEVWLCYPGFRALRCHHVAHALWRLRLCLLARVLSECTRWWTGIEIHPGARIGSGVFIDHGMGVVIGETAEVGDGVTLHQGVTLGGRGTDRGKRHPTLGAGVMVGVGAKILGAIHIGEQSQIGAGAVVVESVPAHCTVVGIPGRVVRRDGVRVAPADLGLGGHPFATANERDLRAALERVTMLERRLREVEELLAERERCRL